MKAKLVTFAICVAVLAIVVRNNTLFTAISGVTV